MRIEINSTRGGSHHVTVDWPVIPRIGETVSIAKEEFPEYSEKWDDDLLLLITEVWYSRDRGDFRVDVFGDEQPL